MKSLRTLGFVCSLFACSGLGCSGSTSVDPTTDDGGTDGTSGDGSVDTGANGDTSASDTGTPGDATDTGPTTDTGPATDTGTTDGGTTDGGSDASTTHAIRYVWVIVMENRNWSSIKGSSSAPYINKTLLPAFAHAEQYYNPPKLHPSEPNYIWMEAGDNLGITNDDDPAKNHKATTDHLVTKLQAAGVLWRSYQEDIDGTKCPLVSSGLYGAKHNPMVFFDDVTNTNSATSANCIEHVRPYPELAKDQAAGKVARYNFVTPNLCNDMHGETLGTSCPTITTDVIKRGDTWLSNELPKIMASTEYKTAGAIFLTWDEGEGLITTSDGPIGMVVISPFAKVGYSNTVKYTHSSLLRTLQILFDVKPFLRDAEKATDLGDLVTVAL